MNSASSPNALQRPWIHLARAAWLLFTLSVVILFVIGTLETFNTPLISCAGPDADCPANVLVTQEDAQVADEIGFPLPFLPVVMFFSIGARVSLALVAAIIFWRRSDDGTALVISVALMSTLLEGLQNVDPTRTQIQSLLFGIGVAMFLPIPFIFPSGRVEPRWTRLPMLVGGGLYIVTTLIFPSSPAYWTLSVVLNLFWVVLGGYAMIYRYRRVSNAVERQQTKWVLLGIVAVFVVGSYYTISNALYPVAQPSEGRIIALLINLPLYLGGYGFLAFSILVAMLRYRLWDIDVLIRRTLQYTLLTGLLALMYFGGVVILQGLLGPLTGNENSPLVTVLTTLGIAALFTPLRRRVQEFIDRRFYRRKYDAERSLAHFAAAARNEVDMDRLAGALIAVVSATMRPEAIHLWLLKEGEH